MSTGINLSPGAGTGTGSSTVEISLVPPNGAKKFIVELAPNNTSTAADGGASTSVSPPVVKGTLVVSLQKQVKDIVFGAGCFYDERYVIVGDELTGDEGQFCSIVMGLKGTMATEFKDSNYADPVKYTRKLVDLKATIYDSAEQGPLKTGDYRFPFEFRMIRASSSTTSTSATTAVSAPSSSNVSGTQSQQLPPSCSFDKKLTDHAAFVAYSLRAVVHYNKVAMMSIPKAIDLEVPVYLLPSSGKRAAQLANDTAIAVTNQRRDGLVASGGGGEIAGGDDDDIKYLIKIGKRQLLPGESLPVDIFVACKPSAKILHITVSLNAIVTYKLFDPKPHEVPCPATIISACREPPTQNDPSLWNSVIDFNQNIGGVSVGEGGSLWSWIPSNSGYTNGGMRRMTLSIPNTDTVQQSIDTQLFSLYYYVKMAVKRVNKVSTIDEPLRPIVQIPVVIVARGSVRDLNSVPIFTRRDSLNGVDLLQYDLEFLDVCFKARVVYDYVAVRGEDELNVKAGDVVEVVDIFNDGWAVISADRGHRIGFVPRNHLLEINSNSLIAIPTPSPALTGSDSQNRSRSGSLISTGSTAFEDSPRLNSLANQASISNFKLPNPRLPLPIPPPRTVTAPKSGDNANPLSISIPIVLSPTNTTMSPGTSTGVSGGGLVGSGLSTLPTPATSPSLKPTPAPSPTPSSGPPVTPVTVDKVVTVSAAVAHLSLLGRFARLESADVMNDLKFLCRAEQRYLMWLDFLAINKPDPELMPLPPLDVAMVWYNHFLTPLRYLEDCFQIFRTTSSPYSFPLHRIHSLPSSTLYNPQDLSQDMWTEFTGEQYTILNDSNSNASDPLHFKCPWCLDVMPVDPELFVLYRLKDGVVDCKRCGKKCCAENVSAKRLADQIVAYSEVGAGGGSSPGGAGRGLLGLWLDETTGILRPDLANNDLERLFGPSESDRLTPIHVLASTDEITWPKLLNLLQNHISTLRDAGRLTNVRKSILEKLTKSYRYLTTPLSIDLVSAVLRQRPFSKKLISGVIDWTSETLAKATIRYHRFLLLMGKEPDRFLVPTLDIDLMWHTHLIFPSFYQRYCIQFLKRIVDHDDFVEGGLLGDAFVATSNIWKRHYREVYSVQLGGGQGGGWFKRGSVIGTNALSATSMGGCRSHDPSSSRRSVFASDNNTATTLAPAAAPWSKFGPDYIGTTSITPVGNNTRNRDSVISQSSGVVSSGANANANGGGGNGNGGLIYNPGGWRNMNSNEKSDDNNGVGSLFGNVGGGIVTVGGGAYYTYDNSSYTPRDKWLPSYNH
ncbi:hypothetical protein HDU76_000340 [Blyttiomyces sp. JEL0837]|nr:hypothetical protein HDU76_000340 [Blyttiomyces sp. JEL0837]